MNYEYNLIFTQCTCAIELDIAIEINNELEVFVQISKTDVGFGYNRGRRPRLSQNPNEVFDVCTKPPTSCLFLFYYN